MAENPNSHIRGVENCNRSHKTFSAMARYLFSTNNQNASKFSSACFSFSILSLATLTSSSSSFKVNCPWHGSNSTNGFLTQSYWSTDVNGKYLLRLFNRASMVILALFLFSYWPVAEPLPGAHGTLWFRGTPVEKHCSRGPHILKSKSSLWVCISKIGKYTNYIVSHLVCIRFTERLFFVIESGCRFLF